MKGEGHLLLEICIPTYGRAETLIANVKEILLCEDEGFIVSVSSNIPDWEIQKAFEDESRVKLHFFAENQGFTMNVKWLLMNSNSKYNLILSDEDFVSPIQLSKILERLKKLSDIDRVLYFPNQERYSLGNLFDVAENSLSLKELMLLSPMGPTYMSGYLFRSSDLNQELLDIAFLNVIGNAYPFILLRNLVLRKGGRFRLEKSIEIWKGDEVFEGGAMHTNDTHAQIRRIASENQQHITVAPEGPFVTSKEETTERFNFFLSHLGDLFPKRSAFFWISLFQLGNRMRNGTGESALVVFELRFKPTKVVFDIQRLEYHNNSDGKNCLACTVFSSFGWITQKSAGVYRKLLSLRSWRI